MESDVVGLNAGTYYIACLHVSPSKLLTAAPTEKTSEVNQNPLTESDSGSPVLSKENCNVVAVTAEKNVATVERFNRLAAACFWANRIVGTPRVEKGTFEKVN